MSLDANIFDAILKMGSIERMEKTEMDEELSSKKLNNRLAYIDFRLYFLGTVTRSDLIARFGIKEAAATRDLADYKNVVPQNLKYDAKSKVYQRQEGFQPLFEYSPYRVLSLLAYGFGDDFVFQHEALIPCETPTRLNSPDLSVLSVLTRAIYQKKAVKMDYQSPNSGPSQREFVPFVLVNTGLRWHVRGYDRKRSHFADFVITRISSPELLEALPRKEEMQDKDIQWNHVLELEIVPHPTLKYPKSIEADYDMHDGVLRVDIRAAIAGYLLRLWNIDCSNEAKLRPIDDSIQKGKEFQLWLRNWKCLYGIENSGIAPGYEIDAF